METVIKHVVRYARPSQLDRAPIGTQLTYESQDDTIEQYVQVSPDERNPQWVRLGHILECVLMAACQDETFMSDLIQAYNENEQVSVEGCPNKIN